MRRRVTIMLLLFAAVFIALGGWHFIQRAVSPVDYRDPLQLAAAVKAHEHGDYGSCSKIAGSYLCVVGISGGTAASYQVTVSADGKSWAVKP
jgi:hypothetical protein